MAPSAAASRAGRTLRRVLLTAVAGAAWLTLSATAAQADDSCTVHGPADDSGGRVVAADCTDADDLPLPVVEGAHVSPGTDPAPAASWAAGAVPVPSPSVAGIAPGTTVPVPDTDAAPPA